MIFVTGDTHIPIDIKKLNNTFFKEQDELTKDDYVIICGDFGGVWDNSDEEKYWRNWLKDKKFTTLFIDGNHENFEILNKYPIEYWNGGKVHFINDSIIHLMRGQVYEIQGKKIFTFGGAKSVDKEFREEGVSWWKEEMPSLEEYDEGINNLRKHNWTVDYVITHTCPEFILDKIAYWYNLNAKYDELTDYLEGIENRINCKHWYFGHFHIDNKLDSKHRALYNDIVKIDDY